MGNQARYSTTKAFKHYGIIAVKLIAVPAGLIWLIRKLLADPRLGHVPFDPWLLAAALITIQLGLLFFAVRMRMVLSAFGIALSFRQTIRIHLQSMFYFFVIPMTVGLEAARFAKIKEAVVESTISSAVLGVALLTDRIIGALAALFIAVAMLPFVQFQIPADWHLNATLLWISAAGGFAVVAAILLSRLRSYLMTLIAQWRGHLGRLSKAFVVAIMVHAFFCFGIYLAARSISIPIEPHQALFVISAAMMFIILPFSVAGAGSMEIAGVAMLLALGMSTEQAVAFTLLSYLARMVAAFEGGIWEIWEGGLMAISRLPAK